MPPVIDNFCRALVGKAWSRASGGGLHHVCYEVDDLDRTARDAQRYGLAMIRRPQPAMTFGSRRIAWFAPREKLLVEFLEATC